MRIPPSWRSRIIAAASESGIALTLLAGVLRARRIWRRSHQLRRSGDSSTPSIRLRRLMRRGDEADRGARTDVWAWRRTACAP